MFALGSYVVPEVSTGTTAGRQGREVSHGRKEKTRVVFYRNYRVRRLTVRPSEGTGVCSSTLTRYERDPP